MHVRETVDAHVFRGAAEAERLSQRGFAFQDEDGSFFDTRGPFGGGGRAGTCDEDMGETRRLRLEAYGGENAGPGAGVVGEDRKIR